MTECFISLEITLYHRYSWLASSVGPYTNNQIYHILPNTLTSTEREAIEKDKVDVWGWVATASNHKTYELQFS